MGNLIERVANNNQISDTEIKEQVESAVRESGIENLLTRDNFYHAFAHLLRGQQLLSRQNQAVFNLLYTSTANRHEREHGGAAEAVDSRSPDQLLSISSFEVGNYLTEHTDILLRAFCPSGTYICIPKLALNVEHQIDFLIVQLWSTLTMVILVSQETPITPIYAEAGVFSAEMNLAITRVYGWLAWIRENNSGFCDMIINQVEYYRPQIVNSLRNRIRYNTVKAKIIVGRRNTLSESERARLSAYNLGSRDLEVVTFDRLFDVANRIHSE